MGLVRLAGFRAVRITSTWEPGLTAPTEHEAAVLGQRRRGGGPSRRPGLRVRLPRRLADDAAHAGGAGGVRGLRGGDRAREPELPRRDRRQRAEPEPLLAAAVQRGRHRRLRAAPYNSLLAATYDAVKAAAPETIDLGRRSRSARRRQAVHRPRHDLADAVHPRVGRGVRWRAAARRRSWTASPSIPTAINSSAAVDLPPNDPDHLALVDQNKLVRLLGKAFDGTAQVGSGLPILYDEYGIESIVPQEKAVQYAGTEPATTRPVDECGAGGGLRTGDQARVLPVERRRHPPLPRPGRARPQRLAVGPVLPRRDAEVVARRRPRHDGRHRRRRRSASARSRSGPSSRSPPAPVRSRSGAIATASTAHGSCGSRPDRSRRGRTDARVRAAGSRSSSAPAWLRGATSSPITFVHATRPGPVVVRGSVEFSVRSPSPR